MIKYKFSPITSEEEFWKAANYIISKMEKLCQEVLKESLPINTVKIFPHYLDEYDYLLNLVKDMGPKASFSSGTSYYTKLKKEVANHNIQYVGVRIVDPYRLQVGCGDFEIKNYEEIRDKYLNKTPYVRDIRNGKMLEIWHPDYDVLGYLVPAIDS